MVPKKIVAIGASSCEGKVDIEGGGFVGRLKRWHESIDQHNSVYNLGISGDTTPGMIKRLAVEAPPRRPDLILIQCGINDVIREGSKTAQTRYSFEDIRESITLLITYARAMAPVVFVSVYPIDESRTTPCSWRPINYLLADAREHARITKEVCGQLKIPYVDIFDAWIAGDYLPYLHTDGLHANSTGHERIFRAIQQKLLSVYP